MIRAFTLLETLIYIGLFSMLMTGITSSLYSLGKNSAIVQTDSDIHDEGLWVLDSVQARWTEQGYQGAVSFPAIDSYIQISLPSVTHDEHGMQVSFTLFATTSEGQPRSHLFSETLYSTP